MDDSGWMTVDGCLVKTQESKLLQVLEKTCPQVTEDVDLPLNAAAMVDAMATLQALQKPRATFGELARQVFDLITKSMVSPASRVGFVIDQYREVSIKGSERLQRAHAHGYRYCQPHKKYQCNGSGS